MAFNRPKECYICGTPYGIQPDGTEVYYVRNDGCNLCTQAMKEYRKLTDGDTFTKGWDVRKMPPRQRLDREVRIRQLREKYSKE